MKFKLRSVWNEEYHMTQYMSKLQTEGYDITKIDNEYCPTYYIEVDNLGKLLYISTIVEHEIIYYKDNSQWVLEIYDGWRE